MRDYDAECYDLYIQFKDGVINEKEYIIKNKEIFKGSLSEIHTALNSMIKAKNIKEEIEAQMKGATSTKYVEQLSMELQALYMYHVLSKEDFDNYMTRLHDLNTSKIIEYFRNAT